MNEIQQNLNWKCLPKETREELKEKYKVYKLFGRNILSCFFGKHNLISNRIEPESILIEKIKTQEQQIQKLSNKNMKFKYNINDLVVHKGKIKKIIHRYSGGGLIMYDISLPNGQSQICVEESKLELYRELNLLKLLKGHEGKTFYCSLIGENVRLIAVGSPKTRNGVIELRTNSGSTLFLRKDGSYVKDGEIQLYPSKDQRDWNKWDKENNHKTPKTWSEIKNCKVEIWQHISQMDYGSVEPVVKSALALLKIHQLIEIGYGGNVSKEAWKDPNYGAWCILYRHDTNKFEIQHSVHLVSLIAFQTKKQAENFLLYSENIQLLKDYYIV